jgi:hypothetical protein
LLQPRPVRICGYIAEIGSIFALFFSIQFTPAQRLAMTHLPPNKTPATTPIDPTRRKLGLGLGASAIFTLASRPVLAGQCTTASAAASGNLSQHGPVISCTGKTVATWAAADGTTYPDGNPIFNTVFTNGTNATWGTEELKAVLNTSDNGNTGAKPNPVSAAFAAALLNIRGGFVPNTILTEMQLVGMWTDWVADGIFEPKASASWDANEIVAYLQTLQA